jgi:sugar phosphate isomerase/epimerase
MNQIRIVGQVITSTNYATRRTFRFTPEAVRDAADAFLRCGITEIELPQGVLDPDNRFSGEEYDRSALSRTVSLLPRETVVIATYLEDGELGRDDAAFLASATLKIQRLTDAFPSMNRAMLHPPRLPEASPDRVARVVETWARLAEAAARIKPGFQCLLHNHYDSSCETAAQLRAYLSAIRAADSTSLRWGPDTGHCHGAGGHYLAIMEEYADLIGGHFHVKGRVAGFDRTHAGEGYRPERDVWSCAADPASGLYGGFVCCADPEVQTPLADVFRIVREKARPMPEGVTAGIEIDVPRQHPRLEVLLSVLYLRRVHGLSAAQAPGLEAMLDRVFSA